LVADTEFWGILASFVERFSAAQKALLDERKIRHEREARRKWVHDVQSRSGRARASEWTPYPVNTILK